MNPAIIGWLALAALLIFVVGGVAWAFWIDYKERHKS